MVVLDILLKIPTPKLTVPAEFKVSKICRHDVNHCLHNMINQEYKLYSMAVVFCLTKLQPTRPDRGWIINPINHKNPWWIILASVIPAILASILIFLDQQITSVIVNRKENKLKVIMNNLLLANSSLNLDIVSHDVNQFLSPKSWFWIFTVFVGFDLERRGISPWSTGRSLAHHLAIVSGVTMVCCSDCYRHCSRDEPS